MFIVASYSAIRTTRKRSFDRNTPSPIGLRLDYLPIVTGHSFPRLHTNRHSYPTARAPSVTHGQPAQPNGQPQNAIMRRHNIPIVPLLDDGSSLCSFRSLPSTDRPTPRGIASCPNFRLFLAELSHGNRTASHNSTGKRTIRETRLCVRPSGVVRRPSRCFCQAICDHISIESRNSSPGSRLK